MTKLRRITTRHEQAIQQIAREEGREPRNVVDLLLDRGLAARAQGNWPTPMQLVGHMGTTNK